MLLSHVISQLYGRVSIFHTRAVFSCQSCHVRSKANLFFPNLPKDGNMHSTISNGHSLLPHIDRSHFQWNIKSGRQRWEKNATRANPIIAFSLSLCLWVILSFRQRSWSCTLWLVHFLLCLPWQRLWFRENMSRLCASDVSAGCWCVLWAICYKANLRHRRGILQCVFHHPVCTRDVHQPRLRSWPDALDTQFLCIFTLNNQAWIRLRMPTTLLFGT